MWRFWRELGPDERTDLRTDEHWFMRPFLASARCLKRDHNALFVGTKNVAKIFYKNIAYVGIEIIIKMKQHQKTDLKND